MNLQTTQDYTKFAKDINAVFGHDTFPQDRIPSTLGKKPQWETPSLSYITMALNKQANAEKIREEQALWSQMLYNYEKKKLNEQIAQETNIQTTMLASNPVSTVSRMLDFSNVSSHLTSDMQNTQDSLTPAKKVYTPLRLTLKSSPPSQKKRRNSKREPRTPKTIKKINLPKGGSVKKEAVSVSKITPVKMGSVNKSMEVES